MQHRPGIVSALTLMSALIAASAAAQAQQPTLRTGQAYVEEVTRTTTLDIKDPMAVFAFVFTGLPDQVKVYPTENYYYFSFIHQGVPYDGNIRLDAGDRDDGKVNFAYTEDLQEWRGDVADTHVVLDAAAGVELVKVDRFVYRMSFRGKSVVFALNDLSEVRPPASALAPDETFIGPVFDESGVRFFLVYNARIKAFHFILDETIKLADEMEPSERAERIVLGKRTGFAFYRMSFRGKSVVFALNDLSEVRPPASALAPDETFVGPVFDESGVRFFLVYDAKIKAFHFILDETVKLADELEPSERAERIVLGKRTGFAFYRDHLRDRKIMIGAYAGHMLTNTYFDGPFDQLPDNFIVGETLRDALIAVFPALKGKIDRFGRFPGGGERVSIEAYVPYRSQADLYVFDRCARARQASPSSYYLCFAIEYDRNHKGRPRASVSAKRRE